MKHENLEKKVICGKEKKSYEKPQVVYSGAVEVAAGCGPAQDGAGCGKESGNPACGTILS